MKKVTIKNNYKWECPKKFPNKRYEQEAYRTLETMCLKVSNDLGPSTVSSAILTGHQSKNSLIVSPAVCAALQSLDHFLMNEPSQMNITKKNIQYVGKLLRFKVYRDLNSTKDYIKVKCDKKSAIIEVSL